MITNTDALPLTLSELVTSVVSSAPHLRRDLIERRLAHWSGREVLKSIGPIHVGSGRSRVFAPDQAYIAALLLRLPMHEISSLKAVAQLIMSEVAMPGKFAELWAAAKHRFDARDNGSVFVAITVTLDEANEKPILIEIGAARSPNRGGLNTPSFYLQRPGSMIIINLSDTFARVKFP